jgi:hypothetical protein
MVNRGKTGGRIERAFLALVAIGGCIGARTALAQDAAGVTVEVGECVKLEVPEERFACYERHVGAAVKQNNAVPSAPPTPLPVTPTPTSRSTSTPAEPPAAAAPSTAPPPSASAAAAPATDDAGREPKPKSASDQSAESSPIVATVTALKESVPKAYLISLDNGQVWRQSYPQWYPLQPGQRVTLSRSKWGEAYRLSAEGLHGFIQVERVR